MNRCPRCQGRLLWDPVDREPTCLPCGWREARTVTPELVAEASRRSGRRDRQSAPVRCDRCGGAFRAKGMARHRQSCFPRRKPVSFDGHALLVRADPVTCEGCWRVYERTALARHKGRCKGQEAA